MIERPFQNSDEIREAVSLSQPARSAQVVDDCLKLAAEFRITFLALLENFTDHSDSCERTRENVLGKRHSASAVRGG